MTTSSSGPTGRRETRDGRHWVVYTREFRAPVEDVWVAVTEPDRLARWVGTWTGDPAAGSVSFRMTAEGEDAPEEVFRIEACDPPRLLRVRSTSPGPDGTEQDWTLELGLGETDGVTTLTFGQDLAQPSWADSIGPGWDYYLDRLVAAETGGDVDGIDFDDYYPAFSEHYRSEFRDA
jgi:uncharacterized protein YndB with AHSA1/START domain